MLCCGVWLPGGCSRVSVRASIIAARAAAAAAVFIGMTGFVFVRGREKEHVY